MIKSNVFWISAVLLAGAVIISIGLTAGDDQTVFAAGGKDGGKAKPIVAYVPRTGQTISYAPGDDGDLQSGVRWPVPRFIDNGDGTITDRLTQLMWTQDASAIATVTWFQGVQAALDYIFAGYDDWRMPNVREMESLFDYGIRNVPEGHPFFNVGGVKWTSTYYPAEAAYPLVWTWQMRCELNDMRQDEGFLNVWPVRGPVRVRR